MFRPLRSIALLTLLGAAGLAAAQPPRPGGPPAVAPGTPRVTGDGAPAAEPRDPTKPSPGVKKALDVGKDAPTGPAAAPIAAAGLVTLKARVIGKDQPPIAYIEVNKQQYAIGPDTKITIGATTYKVLEISAIQVRLKVEPLDEILVLR